MRKALLLGSAALAMLAVATSADAAKRRPTYDELLHRIERLERLLEQRLGAPAQAPQQAAEGEQEPAPPPQPSLTDIRTRVSTLEQRADDNQLSLDNGRPRFRSGDGRFDISIRGRFHGDVASFMQDEDDYGPATPQSQRDLASGAVIRRAQIGVEGRFFKDFWAEMRLNFGGSDTESAAEAVNLMRIAYVGIPNWRLNVGVIQPIFTLADSVSSNEVTFLERADTINTILDPFGGSDARRAVEITYQKSDLLYGGDNLVVSATFSGQRTGGARTTEVSPLPCSSTTPCTDDEGTQALGRIAYRLWSDGAANLQVGFNGASIIDPPARGTGTPRAIQFRDRPEVRVDGNRLVDTGSGVNMAATGGWLWGAEAGFNFANFYLAGEYYEFGIDRDRKYMPAPGDPEFSGWYVEASWIVTGATKSYSATSNSNQYGVWGNPRVIQPFSLDGDSWGEVELAVRYSELDLDWNEGSAGFATPVGGVRGGKESIWTVGTNWYLNNNIRVMLNYLFVDVDRLNSSGIQQGQRLDVAAARVQFAF
jgi:phosphate-selective porin OprO/OprP